MSKNMLDLQLNGKTAIVTGGAGGIGFHIAQALAESGVNLVLADITEDGEYKAEQLRGLGIQAFFVRTDLRDSKQVDRLAAETKQLLGGIDILINNAGIYPRAELVNTTDELWDEVMSVNLRAMFYCCRAVVPQMKLRGQGAIVNIGSSHAAVGLSELFAYSVSKGGVVTLTRNLAGALARDQIRVNCVNPGWVATEKELAVRALNGQTLDWLQNKGKLLPLGRLQTGEDTASIVLFLVSGLANQITGQIVNVDGGRDVGSTFDNRSLVT
ncbi:SDR family NAD(P)-dependent oxidoreductase [Paenibacillus urinalis]|uniref:SDR family NAD(P)-dependent oxidoreductase n=1 Tax=Paenibacillus urinalis TaxID=521520 RepID=A0AAX3N3S8_9BACL|nr:SDR family oxidoreductase [Paenibacillus urinalis]WDH83324.1 SDR family NAD(P)-dependent oxidoreductase [Paenibacillus urinalis]